ncbi:hypothetical protein GUJ93_ZPchr0010g9322 [Zizania palustris]|uniref:RING-type E3 ubiquitin transferase n=1 Tax=Zizania palustris TaxID=103762 RepID=A0A8J6BF88_ZIZPA|nr:hypothetical protein GUJ93_ZPchr0010g9322 [Zizania palustris]
MGRPTKEAVVAQRSQPLSGSNRMSTQGRMACGSSTSRNAASTCGEAHSSDLLARLKCRVNASPANTFRPGSSSSSTSILRPLHLSVPGGSTARMLRDGSASYGQNVHRRADFRGSSDRFLPGSLFRHTGTLQGGPVSHLEDSLNGSNDYRSFGMDESVEDASIDPHREMRMDIDDMSYEELLSLGERIGTVSTGLSDDALSKCLERILYLPSTSTNHEVGDIKCIICQEEYLCAEEVGKMACKHYYHIACIQQWLGQKNWCPICKSVASAKKP